MNSIDAAKEIEKLLKYGIFHGLIYRDDMIPVRNGLLDLLKIKEPYDGGFEYDVPEYPAEILNKLTDYAAENKIIPDDTVTWRDLFDTRIMGCMTPRQSEIIDKFNDIKGQRGIKAATDGFYDFSIHSNYIRMDRIQKNIYYRSGTEYGDLEITINLSKPEKDPRDIAAARKMSQTSYPKCLLCLENVGYAGNIGHPARQNHRVIPVTLNGEQWYFQYSPYVYYNEHCIVFYEKHVPMKISGKTFKRLLDFVEIFPHYFIGSNADLPIVGGSILNHEHFQGGRHVFPMEVAETEIKLKNPSYPSINAGIVKWPMSTLRLSGNKDDIINISSRILEKWREYSDESVGILAYTDGIPHNTITPIARKNKSGKFEMDLVFRNNRTSPEYPLGIFHPHNELHHIKKENIGLIEVMGLAVLPGRLNTELKDIENILTGKTKYVHGMYDENDALYKHVPWIEDMIRERGTLLKPSDAKEYIKKQVAGIFSRVLADAGVFKRDNTGREAFLKFLQKVGFKTI